MDFWSKQLRSSVLKDDIKLLWYLEECCKENVSTDSNSYNGNFLSLVNLLGKNDAKSR